jgi:hypothetical protein
MNMKKILILFLFSINIFAQKVNVVEIPSWYKNANNLADWWKQGFPKITLPNNKKVMFEGDVDYMISYQDYSDYGFNKELKLIGDSNYMNCQPNNADVWNVGYIASQFTPEKKIILLDFEIDCGQYVNRFGNQDKVNNFAKKVKALKPDAQLGLWGIGNIDRVPLYEWGVYSLASANKWKQEYTNTTFARGYNHYNISNPFVYDDNIGNRHITNELVQQAEVHKKAYGYFKNYPSLWDRSETINHTKGVDMAFNLELHHKRSNGDAVRCDWLYKPILGSHYFYKNILWSFLLADGYHMWGVDAHQTDDIDAGVHLYGSKVNVYDYPTQKERIAPNGEKYNVATYYHPQWQGSYNQAYLANWMVSQEPIKGILEASTPVEFVNFGKGDNVTYSKDDCYPSFVELNKTPMIRIKYSQDGTKVLFLASNDYQKALETSTWTIADKNWKVKIELKGNQPTLGWVSI